MLSEGAQATKSLSEGDLLKLRRWNTCTLANAIEQISKADPLTLTNLDTVTDFMPETGAMVGYAVTLAITGDDPSAKRDHPDNFALFRQYIASLGGPKIVVVQDLNKPRCYGSIWGEVSANVARTLGCVGTITDGAIRDVDDMKSAGFKALAARMAVSHAHTWPVRWNCEVQVFGTKIRPGQLIHADKHGFLIIPDDACARVLDAARVMDDHECDTVIAAARAQDDARTPKVVERIDAAAICFAAKAKTSFGKNGEC
jgi:4-hydroxy-4-methyl-2-oxoglutarate aldolase